VDGVSALAGKYLWQQRLYYSGELIVFQQEAVMTEF
jgi:hypothetical protein